MRLFFAIRPPAPIRITLLGAMGGVSGARWQSDGQLHLTLAFLGEVPDTAAEDLVEATKAIHSTPFELEISGVGHFERKGRPTALWAGLAHSDALLSLQERVANACRREGCPPDGKSFRPHVTLARLSQGSGAIGGWLAEHGLLASDPWTVGSFSLYASHLRPEGSLYEPLIDFALTG